MINQLTFIDKLFIDLKSINKSIEIYIYVLYQNIRFQVSGDKANLIQVWNGQTCQHLKTLRGHQGPITVLKLFLIKN